MTKTKSKMPAKINTAVLHKMKAYHDQKKHNFNAKQ